jgi:hypothetical protein
MSQNSKSGEVDKYLEGKSGLSGLYADLPQIEVPRHLDAAILAEAHRAVGSRPGAKRKRSWAIPLGMVASLLVALMVGLQLPHMLKDADMAQQLKENRMIALMDKSMAERPAVAPEERQKTQGMAQQMAKPKTEVARGEPAARAAEAPAQENAPALAVPAASPAAVTGQLGATSALARPTVAAPSPQPAPATAAKRQELRERADIESGTALAKEKKSSAHAAGSSSDSFEQRAPVAAPAPAQLERSLLQPSSDEAGETSLRPEAWLARIKRLKQQGKLDEAKKDLAAFKKRYPDYPVPEALGIK